MKRKKINLNFILILIILLFTTAVSNAEVPNLINYRGSLIQDGSPVNGTKLINFQIYDAATVGNQLWQSGDKSINIVNGAFAYTLGLDNATDFSNIDWKNKTIYLQVVVEGNALTPRERIGSVGYALVAKKVVGIDIVNSNVGLGTNNPGAYKLNVNGNAFFNDSVTIGDSITIGAEVLTEELIAALNSMLTPELIDPSDGASVTNGYFLQWSGVAAPFEVELDVDGSFSNPYSSTTVENRIKLKNLEKEGSPPGNGTYFWRVTATGYGVNRTSAIRSVTIIP